MNMRVRTPIDCPACGSRADVTVSGVVEYDRCTSCGGVWLDCGELEVLLALAHRAGKERAAQHMRAVRPVSLTA